MWGEKRYNDQPMTANGSVNMQRQSGHQTPRNKNRPNIPLPNSRRSITPSRVQ